MTRQVQVRNLGVMDYKPCWDLQEEVFQGMVKAKIARRNAGLSTTDLGPEVPPIGLASVRVSGWSTHMC